jgi:transcriptional regulator with XRE-family HTH domain
MESSIPDDIDRRIAGRVRARRLALELTLDGLAARSGVSRAMISKIERGEASPTASLLDRLAAGLDITIGALVADEPGGELARAATRGAWRDPATGYDRRQITPSGTGSRVEIVEIVLPPGARVGFTGFRERDIDQHVWVLEGHLELTVATRTDRLGPGDCLHMTLRQPITYHNRTNAPCRYAVVLLRREVKP